MCRPTGIVGGQRTPLQQERDEMDSIQRQLRKLIGFNPVVVTSRRPKRARPTGSVTPFAAAATSTQSSATSNQVSNNEWILWEHKLVEDLEGTNNTNEQKDWQSRTSEVVHFFRSTSPYACDTNHVPCPSRTFTAPVPKDQQKNNTEATATSAECAKKGYSLFKQGIKPEWEDPKNANGGSWFIRQYIAPNVLDRYWKNLVAGLVDQKTAMVTAPADASTTKKTEENAWVVPKKKNRKRGGATKKQMQTNKMIFDHINGIRIDDKTKFYSQRAMYKIEIWIDTTDGAVCEQVKEWMLATMTTGNSSKPQARCSSNLRTHWKSFSTKKINQDEEKSEATSTTDVESSCSASL